MRKILVEITVEWEDYDEVSDELIIEDAITSQFEGVSFRVVESDIASRIYDILVVYGGATESNRESFIHYYHTDGDEFRFSGLLGFGGKYRKGRNRVDCYREDEDDDRTDIMHNINRLLSYLDNPQPVRRLYTRDEVETLTLESLGLGMELRQDQLSGPSKPKNAGKSGKEVHKEWFEEKVPQLFIAP